MSETPDSQAPVAHSCNPSYSGGRDQEDRSLKPVQENSSQDPVSKKPTTKKGWLSGSRWRPWVRAPVPEKKKKRKKHQTHKLISHTRCNPLTWVYQRNTLRLRLVGTMARHPATCHLTPLHLTPLHLQVLKLIFLHLLALPVPPAQSSETWSFIIHICYCAKCNMLSESY
jgi:hypothetical protein